METSSANDGHRFPFLDAELDWLRGGQSPNAHVGDLSRGAIAGQGLRHPVYRCPQPEIGWYEIELLPAAAEDQWFRGAGCPTVFQWHGETFDLPAGAVHLAQSRACQNQAFRFGGTAYGLQFHVEMTPDLMELWLRDYNVGDATSMGVVVDPAAIRAASLGAFPPMHAFSRCLLAGFAALCREFQ